MQALLFGGRGDRDGDVLPRIECAGHSADRSSLSGGVGALENKDKRMTGKALVTRQLGELTLIFLEILLVLVVRQFLRKVQIADQFEVVENRWRRRCHRVLQSSGLGGVGAKRRLHRIQQDLADGEIAIALVDAFDDVPRRFARGRFAQQVLPQIVRPVVHAIRPPIVARDAPTGAGIAFERLEALLLL